MPETGSEFMKVFGVGFQRTGTSSLTLALNMLGIKTLQLPKELYHDIDHDIIRQYSGFTDAPIPLLYKELDKKHPNSKFIHTIRDEAVWLKSAEWLLTTGTVKFKEAHTKHGKELNKQLFGRTTFDQEQFLATYRAHNQEVSHYFADRPDDYLVIDITRGEGFEVLCPFLDVPIPDAPFPHRNKRQSIARVYGGRLYETVRRRLRALLDTE